MSKHILFQHFEKYIRQHGWLYIFFLAIIPLYTLHLNTLGFAMQGDEAEIALQALQIIPQHLGIIGVGWSDLPLVSFLPHALTMAIFGANLFGQRMGSVLFGILSVWVLYFFVRELFTQRVALLATIFLAVSHIWLAFSRLGLTNVQAAFVMLCCFYFTIHGIHKKKLYAIILGGIFLGLCLYSYYAARITPFIILPYFFFTILSMKQKKIGIWYTIVFGISAVLVMIPQAFFYVFNPHTFSDRTSEVYIFSNSLSVQEWRKAMYPNASIFQILTQQFLTTINIFAGDQAGHYGYKGQLFDWASILLFFFGAIYSFFLSKKIWILLTTWFLLVLFGSVLTTSPISLSRVVVGLPVIYIFVALGIDAVIKRTKKWKTYATWGALLIVGYIVLFNLNIYFFQYPKQQLQGEAGDGNALNATNIAYYLNTLPNTYQVLFLTAPNLYANFAPFVFLSPQTQRFDISDPANYALPKLCPKNTIYVIYTQYPEKFLALQKLCTNSESIIGRNTEGQIRYYLIKTNSL